MITVTATAHPQTATRYDHDMSQGSREKKTAEVDETPAMPYWQRYETV